MQRDREKPCSRPVKRLTMMMRDSVADCGIVGDYVFSIIQMMGSECGAILDSVNRCNLAFIGARAKVLSFRACGKSDVIKNGARDHDSKYRMMADCVAGGRSAHATRLRRLRSL